MTGGKACQQLAFNDFGKAEIEGLYTRKTSFQTVFYCF